MIYAVLIIISYLLGSIPFGLLLAKWAGKGDIRKVGSKSTGATNVMRVGGLKLAGLTWALDMAKAIIAVLLGRYIIGIEFGALCGAVAILGHIFPVWLRFRGGKGVSSLFGFMLAINPLFFVVCAIEWLIIVLGTGYSSLGALTALTVLPILGFAMDFNVGLICLVISVIIIFWGHRQNIQRLINGTESKVEWKWKK
ncbi:MAG: glycerol-3-phosphate 1-O-acyltransferase PlsY [Alphaproteobacteria bacterium]|nr:glycerol-3-phosphate 1-O-acyltransferase PlsY [Alphaproteobacteria bacterium]